jgi:hypothetical protein
LYSDTGRDRFKAWLPEQQGSLDLGNMFWLSPEGIFEMTPHMNGDNITTITLNQNFNLTNYGWLQDFPKIQQITLINLPELDDIGFSDLRNDLPTSINDVTIHFCQKLTMRIMLDLLALPNLEVLCINNSKMVCQPNAYSGVIGETEWKVLSPATSLNKLLINSGNLSMDALSYMLPFCPNLERLVLHPTVYETLAKNIVEEAPDVGLGAPADLTIASLNAQTSKTVKRPFKITGLLKDKYSEPFSQVMMDKVKADGDQTTEDRLMAEVIAEMKARGEIDSADEAELRL